MRSAPFEPVKVDQEGKEEVEEFVDEEGWLGREEESGSSYSGESRGETRAR